MQPGHEEVALAPKEEELLAELLDESSSFAQEMRVRQKQEIRTMYKILFMCLFPKSGKKPYLKEMLGHTLTCGAKFKPLFPSNVDPSFSCFSLLKKVTLSSVPKARMPIEYSSP